MVFSTGFTFVRRALLNHSIVLLLSVLLLPITIYHYWAYFCEQNLNFPAKNKKRTHKMLCKRELNMAWFTTHLP